RLVPLPLPQGAPLWPVRIWPLSEDPAPPRALLLALLAGLVAALTLRLDVPGLGVALTGAAMLGAALASRSGRLPVAQAGAAVLAIALAAVGAVRAADWLFALCLLAALAMGVLALVGGRSWIGLALGLASPLFVQFRAWGWSIRGVRELGTGKGGQVARILVVGLLSLALAGIFGALFYGADHAFAGIVDRVLPHLDGLSIAGNTILGVFVAGLTLSAGCLAALPPRFDGFSRDPRPVRTWEWAVPVAVLDVLFGGFAAIQLAVLFGHRKPALAGDYAEYARQGFWQLLAVTVLTLLVVAVAAAYAGRATRTDRIAVRLLIGGLCAFTLVIVASALSRMQRYEEAFGFTQLRILVHSAELWLGLVFVLVLAAGIRLSGRWLPRAIAGTGALALLALAGLNPDAYAAAHNVDRYNTTRKIDVWYLRNLSPDAVPALQRLHDPLRSCALATIAEDLRRTEGDERWYLYNAGRAAARKSLTDKPVDWAKTTCPAGR
ncbi:MAG: hypothetical protein QOJ50_1482, partial [Cryptosporangiaceae bacterium]|nr:hypothetical protein [Cryptosporangiaceae bacterium]